MRVEEARAWIIKASLTLTVSIFLIVVLGPFAGLPLDSIRGDTQRLLEILLPVFVGYLGSASHFVFSDKQSGPKRRIPPNAVLLVKGPVLAWSLMCVAAFGGFWFSNSDWSPPGAVGMSIDSLAGLVTATLALQTATTNIAVSYLFSADKGDRRAPASTGAPTAVE